MATQQGRRRQELVILCCAALCCVALPLAAQSNLDRKVHVELAAAASEAIGAPVQLGQASVGLTGTLELSDLRVSDFFSAERVIARVSPSRFGPSRLAANEILVESPKALVRVQSDGSTNLDGLLANRNRNLPGPGSDGESSPKGRASMIEQVRLVGGSLELELVGRGHLSATEIAVLVRGEQVHGVLGNAEIALQEGAWKLGGKLPRTAFDYERHGQGLQRVLGYGGALQVSGPRGRALLQELTFSHRSSAQSWQLSARTGVDRPTGSLQLQVSPSSDGLELILDAKDAPLTLAGPWLPAELRPEGTLVSGSLRVKRGATTNAAVALSFADLDIAESGFSKRPMRLDLELRGNASVRESDDSYLVQAELSSLRSSALELSGSASGAWQKGSPLPTSASVKLDLAEVECDAALNALPSALRPMLAGLELRGRMASHLQLVLSRDNPDDTSLKVDSGIDGCQVVREPPSANTLALRGDYEHRNPSGQTLLLKRGASGFTAIRDMPRYVPLAFVAAEDALFFSHNGFDPHQIERSLAIDVQEGRFVRGGSTISQQLVKNLFLHRQRTVARKLQEAALTWRLESNLSKSRILEIYLNIIEFGDNGTYGITSAAERWFGVKPKELTILQTAFLAAIIPEPTSMSARLREAQGLDPASAERVAVILRAMRRGHAITTSEYQKASRQSLVFAPGALASQPN